MILCIEETHRHSWIHRDIKPDNFLISASGHLKISDFGLAFDGHWTHNQTYYNDQRYSLIDQYNVQITGDAQDVEEDQCRLARQNDAEGRRSLGAIAPQTGEPEYSKRLDYLNTRQMRKFARSVVGTSQYMAPEVICGDAYDGRCDWWSVGIILYECLYGSTPFFDENRDMTKNKIRYHKQHLQFPPADSTRVAHPASHRGGYTLAPVSVLAIDLISSLLEDKEYRLSSPHYRYNDSPMRRPGGMRYPPCIRKPGFVFPNDAEAIKAHEFFSLGDKIDWENHHMTRPPFIPHINQDLAKYFDHEADILSESDNFDRSSAEDLVKAKRPRDRLLRDPDLAPIVMEERKKGAFIGYTWRRPGGLEELAAAA